MDTPKLHLITFSPTGTSCRIGKAIAQGSGLEYTVNDLTRCCPQETVLGTADVAVFCVPVYGGHVAPTALQRMSAIGGQDTPAVIVVVYGNRHYEQALDELSAFVTGRGFRIIAAGTFIGEHSYSTAQTPIAAGRPDADDLGFACRFGASIAEKLASGTPVQCIDTAAIEAPAPEPETMARFKQTVMTWMKQGLQMPAHPMADPALCTQCGTCASLCPTTAISPESPLETDVTKCIKCCACVKGCPTAARTFSTPFAPLLSENFSARKANQTLL